MTARELFDRAYLRTLAATCAQLDEAHADECWRAVQDVRASAFDIAASRLAITSRWLPRPADWLEACTQVVAEQDREALIQAAEEAEAERQGGRYHCAVCQDTGWELHQCPPGQCLRPEWHRRGCQQNRWVTRCACREANQAYRAKVARSRAGAPRTSGRDRQYTA